MKSNNNYYKQVGFLSRKNNGDQNAFDQYLDDVYVYLEGVLKIN